MRPLWWVPLALVLGACRSQAPAAGEKPAGSVASPARVDASAPAARSRPELLAEIGRRFGAGLSPSALATLAGATAPVQSGASTWTISVAKLGLELGVDAPTAAAPATWIRAQVRPEAAPVTLGEVAGVFGAYRKLPPGEYTWVMFEGFRPAEVVISASALSGGQEAAWRVARVQFQRPAAPRAAPGR